MKYGNYALWLSLSTLTALPSHAEETDSSTWKGEAELGYMSTSGNTDTESLVAKGKIVNERVKWRHTGTLEIVNKNDSGTTTADRKYITGKSDYKIDDLSYIFFLINYEDDRFSGYKYRINEIVGYGYTVIKREDLMLALEAGVGARQSKLETGSTSSEGVIRGAANLDWKISETATFTQVLSVDAGEDTTITRSISALKLQIVGNLAAKLAYSYKQTSDVPPGVDKTDTETLVTLIYSF